MEEQGIPEVQTLLGKPKVKWLRIVLFSVLGLLLAAGLVFAGYKLRQLQQEREQARSRVEQIELTRCNKDEDCIVAIRLDLCCPCPEAVSREALKKDKNLVEYEFGRHYPPSPSEEECRRIVCSPCALWNKAVCEDGKCKGIFEEEISGYQIFGSFTRGASEDDIGLFSEKISQYSLSIGIMESFPPGFQIRTLDKESCKEIRKILPSLKFVSSFGECRQIETPLHPGKPLSPEE